MNIGFIEVANIQEDKVEHKSILHYYNTVIRQRGYGLEIYSAMEGFDSGFIFSGGRILYIRYGAIQWRNQDWMVFFMFPIPKGEGTTLWEEL